MFFPDSWVRLGRWLIIGSALLALAACSAVRVAYDNGPSLAGLWLDRWLDLDRQQEAALEPALQRWFEWHRASELPVYAERMGRWRERAAGEVDADAVCALVDETRAWSRRALDAALPAASELLPAITDAQWAHLQARQGPTHFVLRERAPHGGRRDEVQRVTAVVAVAELLEEP